MISTKDALIIPVGTAITPTPTKAIIEPNILPPNVIGYIASKPTPVKEETAHQKEDVMLEKFWGWTSFSMKYIPEAEKNRRINAMEKVKYNSVFTLLTPLPNKSNDLLNLPNFKILDIMKSLKILINLPSKPKAAWK